MPAIVVEKTLDCPFCGESISILLDLSAGDQSYIEDCQVCCRPIEVSFVVNASDDADVRIACAS